MKEKGVKRNFFKRFFDIIFFVALAVFFTGLQTGGIFNKLDYRLYDGLLSIRKAPSENKKIALIDADNKSIQDLGEWPWSRNLIGDVLLRLKELGVNTTVFDIEYLSPSSKGVPENVETKIDNALEETYNNIDGSIRQLSEGIKNNYYTVEEIPEIMDESVSSALDESMGNLQKLLSHSIYRDNDEYLAKCLEFFNNSWLTINVNDLNIQYDPEDIREIKKRVLIDNVEDEAEQIGKNNRYLFKKMYGDDKSGFFPALPKIMKGARGAGFTNVAVDSDGTRRRIELLYDFDGRYLGQLAFAPLLKYLDVQKIKVRRNLMVLENVRYPGDERRFDIRIPLDDHGTMLINWLHKPYIESFKHVSFSDIKWLDKIEEVIVENLKLMDSFQILDENGNLLSYFEGLEKILNEYAEITKEKENLLNLCNGVDQDGKHVTEITAEQYENYFTMRSTFYADVHAFVQTRDSVDSEIFERLAALKENGDTTDEEMEQIQSQMKDCFDEICKDEKEFNSDFTEYKSKLEDSFCIMGHTASSTTDMGATPFESRYENVGCHANVVNTILQRNFIRSVSWYWIFGSAIILNLGLLLVFRRKSIRTQNIVYAIAAFCVMIVPVISLVAFGAFMPAVGLMIFVVLNYFGGLGIRFRLSSKEKKFIRQAFSTYVSTDVVNEIIKDPTKALKLGGEEKNITALFTDIRKFSTFSELVSPEKLVSILNDYLGALSDVILANRGTIDKYIGDSIVSFFGAPLPLEDHAYRAVCSAVGMKKAEDEFNSRFLMENEISDPRFTKYFSEGLFSRIGINTGKMVAGNMGTTGKMNYTAMGNDMNLASRLEGVNKKYGSKILISDKTWNEVNTGIHENEFVVRRADKVRVVGISTPVQLYNVIGFRSEISNAKLEQIDVFHQALELYLKKDFAAAMKGFMHAHDLDPNDETALIFSRTCNDYVLNGVPDDWDGIINLTSK